MVFVPSHIERPCIQPITATPNGVGVIQFSVSINGLRFADVDFVQSGYLVQVLRNEYAFVRAVGHTLSDVRKPADVQVHIF